MGIRGLVAACKAKSTIVILVQLTAKILSQARYAPQPRTQPHDEMAFPIQRSKNFQTST